jgi:MFS family permease
MTPCSFKPSRWTLLFLMLSSMLMLMGGAAVAPALPLIGTSFPQESETAVSLIITLPALAIALTGFFIGGLADRIGKIPVLAASVAIFSLAGTSGYYLTTFYGLLAGRFLLGIGIAGITCTTTSLIICYYDAANRARVLGYQAAAMGLGALVLETSGGFLASWVSWRAAFLIYLVGVIVFVGIILTMKEPALPERKADREAGPCERFPAAVLLPVYAMTFFGMMLFFLLPAKLPYLLENMGAIEIITGSNPALASGIFLGLLGCSISFAGLLSARFAECFSRDMLLALAFFLIGAGLCGLMVATTPVTVGLCVICVGTGNGLLMPVFAGWIASVTPKCFIGMAMGGYAVALNLGQFATSLAFAPVIAAVSSYGTMFFVFGCTAFVPALGFLLVRIRKSGAVPGQS